MTIERLYIESKISQSRKTVKQNTFIVTQRFWFRYEI